MTASLFGEVLRQRADTPPDSLVLRIIKQRQFTSTATDWGIRNELVALQEYESYQKSHRHSDITVCSAGFVICESHPFLGASPDAYVCDPSRQDQYGLVAPLSIRKFPLKKLAARLIFAHGSLLKLMVLKQYILDITTHTTHKFRGN